MTFCGLSSALSAKVSELDAGPELVGLNVTEAVQDALAAKGHQLDIRNVKGVGSVKAILIDPRTGVLMGGVSPTGDSYVMAW